MAWPSATASRAVSASSVWMCWLSCATFFATSFEPISDHFVEVHLLVLQRVCELVRQHRLLLVGLDPVEQVYGLGLVVVEAGDLLGEQRDRKAAG